MDSNEIEEKSTCKSDEDQASSSKDTETSRPESTNESNTNVSNKEDAIGDTTTDDKIIEPIEDTMTTVESTESSKQEDEPTNGLDYNKADEKSQHDEIIIDIDKFQIPEATDGESVHDKCEQEPMDIDEILESLNTDPDTITSSEEYCDASSKVAAEEEPPQIDGSIIDSVAKEISEQNDVPPIVEDISGSSKQDLADKVTETNTTDTIPSNGKIDLQENPIQTIENVDMDNVENAPEMEREVHQSEGTSETVEEDVQIVHDEKETSPVAECTEIGDKVVTDTVNSPEQVKQSDDGKSEDVSAIESVNVFDLMMENKDLFGGTDVILDEPQKLDKTIEANEADVSVVGLDVSVSVVEPDVSMNDVEPQASKCSEELDATKDDNNLKLPSSSMERPNEKAEVPSSEDQRKEEVKEKFKASSEHAIKEGTNNEEKVKEIIKSKEPLNGEQSLKMEEPIKTAAKPPLRRECLNVVCKNNSGNFYEAPEFVINHFHLNKRSKIMYICEECYNIAVESYSELCAALEDKQPLFLKNIKYSDLVEIIDSSDEEDDDDKNDEKMGKNDTFDAETLSLIENELESVINDTLKRVDIDQQMNWNRQILATKIEDNEKNCAAMMDELKTLQRRIDKLYTNTYNFKHSFVEEVQSLDLVTLKPTQICNENYPPVGEMKHTDIEYNTLYYTFRQKLVSRWLPCKVTSKIETNGKTEYKVKFYREKRESINVRVVPRKYLAYGRASEYRLNIGTRVIAMSDCADNNENAKVSQLQNNFYPGIIAEPLTLYTNWRYLVFFDDGYVQYVHHEDIRVICECIEKVWDLIEEPGAKTFIESYMKGFKKKRPIVQVRRGQRIQTEVSGKWFNAIVNEVDGSLVQVFFEETKRYEWIYRGSTRLFPLYKKLNHVKMFNNRNEATIEYIVIDDEKEPERSTEPPVEELPEPKTPPSKSVPVVLRTFASQAARDTPQQKQREQKRAVAKKSTAPQPKPAIQHMNNSTIYVDEDKPKGKVVYYTAKKHIDVKKYLNHQCQPSCLLQVQHNLSSYSPLSKPLLTGFERQIAKTRFNKKYVVYRAPCGRRLRDMSEMHKYLRMTGCKLNVDNFTFDPLIHCLAEYVIESFVMRKPDLSGGVEKMPIQLVNCYDNSMPPPCTYSAKRIPTEGVNLNCDDDFLCGCDCTDDCLDKSKCACWKLTLQGAKYGNPDTPIEDIGYQYKRLNEPVPTGIYECNNRCKCKSNCLNRVVQHPIQLKLQVFKTVNRGWGLRCLNDVPKGSFICCYAGNLLTETSANEAGGDLGDEYFAELDYIEVVENMKEGYEPEVVQEENDSSGTDEDFDVEMESLRTRHDDSDDEFVARSYTASSEDSENRRYRTRNSVDTRKKPETVPTKNGEKRKERNSSSDDESDEVRQVKNFMASNTMPLNDDPDDERCKSIRKLFGTDEAVYIMDAKKAGNIGRYFNHSCGPNLFVQNVFVDTHDLRFPWVAFFASTHIRAGTELTWNYNYEVGSVPGKVLICQCGDEKCRGRIL